MVNNFMPRGSFVAPTKKPVTAHDLDRIIVRLPDGMREKIAELAATNGRSMTAEVVAALEQHLKGPDRLSAIEAFIEEHRSAIETLGELWNKVESLEYTTSVLEGEVNPQRYDPTD